MPSTLYAVVYGLVVVVALSAIVAANRRLDLKLAAAGKCPACCGEGSAWVNMNGLEGCGACRNQGTLRAYNDGRRELYLRPLTVDQVD